MDESNGNDAGATVQSVAGWRECASWLTRCRALRADHKANWPNATAVDLAYILRDGVLLCNLLNSIEPGCIDSKDINQKPQMAQFLCLRNIKAFLSSCSRVFALPESDLFEPSMLFDLSNFHRVLCTLSALSNTEKFLNKGIVCFNVGHGRSQEDIYKDLQSAGVGREDESRQRRYRRREGPSGTIHYERNLPEATGDEDGYGAFCSQARSEEIYQDLCSLNLSSSPKSIPAKPSVSVPHGSLTSSQSGTTRSISASTAACAQSGPIPLSGVEKRDYVVQELVETERNYVEVLNSLIKHFSRPLTLILRPEESSVIFFKIKELLEIHAGFLSQLRCRRGPHDGAALAQVFLDWREKFLIYGEYCANLTIAQNTLQDVCANNEAINAEVLKCQQEANNGKFKLRDILSVPMQRILKYHLLLDKLVEETPREWVEDRSQLEKARNVMVDIAQYINEVKRDSDTIDIIKDIQHSISDWERTEDMHLKDFGRLMRDGELKIKAHGDQRIKARYVFIFELAVLICKAGRGDSYCFKETIRLEEYRVEDHTNRKPVGKDSRWSFQWLLVHKQGSKAYTLYARTENQKQIWLKAMQDAVDNVNPSACRNTNHKFKLTTFDKPRSCDCCDKFLKGRIFQGYSCDACKVAVHKQCISYTGRCLQNPPAPPPLPPPPPPLPCERELCDKLWYVGELGREAAARKLESRENGTYMLRIRPAANAAAVGEHSTLRQKDESNYALSLKADGTVKHIRLFKREVDGADLYYLSQLRFFKSIVELIEYYERFSLVENFEKLDQRLLWPYRRILAKALYDFRATEPNQLSLRKGCRVVVLSKEGDSKGWWKGKILDAVGFFPKEYVEEE